MPIKPVSCEKCPASKIDKGVLKCLCTPQFKADINKNAEKYEMWKNCQIAWDKPKQTK